MIITSKFPGRCKACQAPIVVGQRVSWVKGVFGVECCTDELKALRGSVEASRATDATIDYPKPANRAYMPFQRAGIAYALEALDKHGACLIADEMGLGKTIQAIGVINASPAIRRVFIVCPASLKLNWERELGAWGVHSLQVGIFPEPSEITIVNYDILKKVKLDNWDLLICDEAHYLKNDEAKRTKELRRLAGCCKKILFLTGTPISNRPRELWSLLQIMAPATWDPAGSYKGKSFEQGQGGGWWKYAFRYCDAKRSWVTNTKCIWDFSGASNLEELQERLRSSLMIRRLKMDVLTDLPPKVRQVVPLEGDYPEDDGDMGDWSEATYDKKATRVAFTDWSRVRCEQGIAKVPAVVSHISEILDEGQKVVIFAHHKEVIRLLHEELGGVVVTGDTSQAARQAAVDAFQTDPSVRVFIGSIGAAGTGITLTAASTVVFAELDPRPYIMSQAEDRLHRIGQKDSVLVQHLVWAGSLDEKIASILVKKQAVIVAATDTKAEYGIQDEIAWKQCTCLAGEGEAHTLWCDYAEESPEVVAAPEISPKEIERIRAALRTLAACCDGAQSEDEQGFNKFDSQFGKSLAARASLTPKQALAARKMLRKYKRQIGDV